MSSNLIGRAILFITYVRKKQKKLSSYWYISYSSIRDYFLDSDFSCRIFDKLITPLLPLYLNPNTYLPRDVPGLGLIVLIIFFSFYRFYCCKFFWILYFKKTDFVLSKIPLVKVFYNTIKQILETILEVIQMHLGSSFNGILRKGVWVIGFTTGQVKGVKDKIKTEMVNVFVPTTPNPTSGFLLLVPKRIKIFKN